MRHTHKACSHSYTLNFKFKWRSALACSFIKRPATFKMLGSPIYIFTISLWNMKVVFCVFYNCDIKHILYIISLSLYRWWSSLSNTAFDTMEHQSLKLMRACNTLSVYTHLSNCYLQLYIIVHCYLILTCNVYYTAGSTAPCNFHYYMLTLPFSHLYRKRSLSSK